MSRSQFRVFLAVGVLALAVASCGGGTPADSVGFPVGEWTATCARGVVRVVDFRADGIFTLHNGGALNDLSLTTTAGYSATDSEITFGPDEHCDGSGTYTWSLEGDELYFVTVADDCWPRYATFEEGLVWTRLDR